MTITRDKDKFIIKTKKAAIELGEHIKVGDFSISSNGEYEVSEVALELKDEIANIFAEELNIVFLDGLSRSLEKEETEEMSSVDILFIPVGGGEVLDSKAALEIISELEPKIVIPTHYKDLNVFSNKEGLKIEKMAKLKIAKNSIGEERRVVELQ